MHHIAAEVAIVEDALPDHYLHNTFLHQALGLRLGVECHDFDLAFPARLLDCLTSRRSIIRIEGDEPSQIGVFLNGSLSVAQSDFRFHIIIHHLHHFQSRAFEGIHHAGDTVLSVLGCGKAYQANHLTFADDLQCRFRCRYTCIIV